MRTIVLAILLTLVAVPVLAADYFLQPDGSGDFATIQAAVYAASNGDVIWLSPGVYSGAGNRDVEVMVDVQIRALVLGQPTVIEAGGSSLFPHRAFYVETCSPVFYGLTFQGGYETDGGGVHINEAAPTFEYCIFRDNQASSDGGAVFAEIDAYPVFSYTVFDHNTAGDAGGGIMAVNSSGVTVDQGTFLRNSAQWGSSVYLVEGSTCDLTNSILAFGRDGEACSDYYGGGYTVGCTNVAMNEGGDWVSSISGMNGLNGNISADPQLCDPMAPDANYAPSQNSPSASPACGFQGAVAPDMAWEHPVYGLNEFGEGLFPTIQAAIDGVVSGGIIALDDGIYTGTGNRDLIGQGKVFTLKARGTNPGACVLDAQGLPGDPHRVIRFLNGETTDTRVEGLTLTGGYLNAGSGGAVLIQNGSSPMFESCVFTGNHVGVDGGGAVAILGATGNYSKARFQECVFTSNNSDHDGGAVLADYWNGYMSHCDFDGNQADHNGGDVCATNPLALAFAYCTFLNGVSTYGHSVHLENGLDPTRFLWCEFSAPHDAGNASLHAVNPDSLIIEECDFTGNRGINGGAIHTAATDGGYHFLGIQSSTFTDNFADEGYGSGGAVFADSMTVGIMESTFIGNDAYLGGALYLRNSDLTMALSGFEGNDAASGGACYFLFGQASIVSCYWSANSAGVGSAVHFNKSDSYLENCNFLDNPSRGNGGLFGGGTGYTEFFNCMFAGNTGQSNTIWSTAANTEILFEKCTFHGNDGLPLSSSVEMFSAHASQITLDRCLITDNLNVWPASSSVGGTVVATNCNINGNRYRGEATNYTDALAGQFGVNGNLSQFPIYCDRETRDLTLNEHSICLPANNPNGVQIGARGVGCYGVSSVPEAAAIPAFTLKGNAPNPFNPRTIISFSLAKPGTVRLQVFDVRGHLVKTLVSGKDMTAGKHDVEWDGTNETGAMVGSGVYLCRLFADGKAESIRMALLK